MTSNLVGCQQNLTHGMGCIPQILALSEVTVEHGVGVGVCEKVLSPSALYVFRR